MKKIFILVVLLGVLVMLAGCADKDKKKEESTNNTQTISEQDKKDMEKAREEKERMIEIEESGKNEQPGSVITANGSTDTGVDSLESDAVSDNTEKPEEEKTVSSSNADPFGVEIPLGGGVNYEYEIVSAMDDNGNEASWNHLSWFVCYQRGCSYVQAPIWAECGWENAIGTMEHKLPANFTDGELELTSYGDMGEIGSSKRLRFDIKKDSATVYNVDDRITYTCKLYTTFSWTE